MTEHDQIGGLSLSFPAEDNQTNPSLKSLPRRLRRRLLEPKSPVSAEEIDSKLRKADLRRQQYYESLSSKAKPKMRSPKSERIDELSQKLESNLNVAEQKRLSILEKDLARLAKLDEEDINVDDDVSLSFKLLPSCVGKACSIVEAVEDLNFTTNIEC